jgi:uncharacterized integral membrane protein (TIGR00698 family)
MGLVIAQTNGHPFIHLNQRAISILLQISVVGLGFGMNVFTAMQTGTESIMFTVGSILFTLTLGYLIGIWFKVENKTSFLISAGTAICGGSAIAALAPVMNAEERQVSVALCTVFILNTAALFLFPGIGLALDLSQSEFGLWCALAIHDTSSVVGASTEFGTEALQIATTVKLARALWIIPIAFGTAFIFKNNSQRVKIPYFIGLFVMAMIANTYIPAINLIGGTIVRIAKMGLTLSLFLIGAGLTRSVMQSVDIKPLLQGVILWFLISLVSLWAVMNLV